jgi:hypothetical protein
MAVVLPCDVIWPPRDGGLDAGCARVRPSPILNGPDPRHNPQKGPFPVEIIEARFRAGTGHRH